MENSIYKHKPLFALLIFPSLKAIFIKIAGDTCRVQKEKLQVNLTYPKVICWKFQLKTMLLNKKKKNEKKLNGCRWQLTALNNNDSLATLFNVTKIKFKKGKMLN